MAKKFKIKDGADEIIVEEIEEEKPAEKVEEKSETHDDEEVKLSSEEISALKGLAAKAPELLKLLEVEGKEHAAAAEGAETHDGAEEEKAKEEAEAAKKAEEEEKKAAAVADSKKGFGAVETKDSKASKFDADANGIEIEDAWTKRYGGNR